MYIGKSVVCVSSINVAIGTMICIKGNTNEPLKNSCRYYRRDFCYLSDQYFFTCCGSSSGGCQPPLIQRRRALTIEPSL